MSDRLGDDVSIELPPGTPVEQTMFLIRWIASVENHPSLDESTKEVARALALDAAKKIAKEALND